MKYLIMTEGTCEKALLDVLLEKNILVYEASDLLYETVFKARQLENSLLSKINQLPIFEKVSIIRIGDKLSDELKIPRDVKNRIEIQEKICIKPEFEILHIIYENKFQQYNKQKSYKKPSKFIYSFRKDYEKTYKFNYEYFSRLDDDELLSLFKEYDVKRIGAHDDNEKSILSIVKNKN